MYFCEHCGERKIDEERTDCEVCGSEAFLSEHEHSINERNNYVYPFYAKDPKRIEDVSTVKAKTGVMVDRRLVKFFTDLNEWNDGTVFSVTITDIDETFWFDDKVEIQEFLNVQARERFYDKSLREGYFDYINENNDTIRYYMLDVKRGKVLEFASEIVDEEEKV